MSKQDLMQQLRQEIDHLKKHLNNILGTFEPKGLELTISYHCNRCDYLWFPKDFDVIGKNRTFRDIFNLIPPKACARCKSKLWNKQRQRKRKLPVNVPDRLNDGMLTIPRLKASERNIKRLTAQMENIRKEIPIVIQNKKKKKKTIN